MDEFAGRRWNPGFVAMRWRHLFWLLPLLGMTGGVAWSWRRQFKETPLSGYLFYSPPRTTPASNGAIAGEGASFMSSEAVLEKAAGRLAPKRPWWMESGAAPIRASQSVGFDPDLGVPRLQMTVAARGERLATEIWSAIYESAREIAISDFAAGEQARTASAKGKVLRLEREVADLSFGQLFGGKEVESARSRLQGARKELKQARLSMAGRSPYVGVALISPPRIPAPASRFGPMGELGIQGGLGLGAGVLAAALLAYLLECLKPGVSRPPFLIGRPPAFHEHPKP